jgi:hypothetical protein
MGESNPLGDAQPQAATFDGVVVARVAAKETFEDARLQFRRDARAGGLLSDD